MFSHTVARSVAIPGLERGTGKLNNPNFFLSGPFGASEFSTIWVLVEILVGEGNVCSVVSHSDTQYC
jgi:hypothetical protein